MSSASYCNGVGLFGAGTSAGVANEMVALGGMDTFLIKGATVTFFRFRYARHTNFAMDTVGQQFNNATQFGGFSQMTVQRSGDLLYWMYLVIRLPGIRACPKAPGQFDNCDPAGVCSGQTLGEYPSAAGKGCGPCACTDQEQFRKFGQQYTDNCDPEVQATLGKAAWLRENYGACYTCNQSEAPCSIPQDDTPWVHWTNAVGQYIVRNVQMLIGTTMVSQLWADYLYMWEELSGKAGKRLREMIGKRKSRRQLIKDSSELQTLYVPLPFYNTMCPGNALPLCTLQANGVQIQVYWERLQNLIVTSSPTVQVRKCVDGGIIQDQDLFAWLDIVNIYLDIDERNKFTMANFDQLICQQQMNSMVTSNGPQVVMRLNFSNPIIELIWAVRRKCNENRNMWSNYSGIDGRDPITQVSLRLNNNMRFAGREGRWYRLVQPYQFHSSIPKAFVYCYSFALYPEDQNPTGSCNFDRIDNVDFIVCLQDGLGREQVTIIVFARNWNIIRYTEGVAGTLFA